MQTISRRSFLKKTAAGGLGLVVAPTILVPRRTHARTAQGTLVFEPHFVQDQGRGPRLADFAYATDDKWDAFRSNLAVTDAGVAVSDAGGVDRFGINVRWYVEEMGYLFITADNAGDFYTLPATGEERTLNLNYELAASRVARNRRRMAAHRSGGWQPSRELQAFLDLSEGYLEDAQRSTDGRRTGRLAQKALRYALKASEAMELEKAEHLIQQQGYRPDFFLGCDARAFYQMDPDLFLERFDEAFNYATITYYITTGTRGMPDFEGVENKKRFGTRDALFERLRELDVTVEGRPLFWPHMWVTPDWLRAKSFDALKRYVEDHVREVVGHYGDRMYAWEVVNEMHDWANEHQLNPEQIVEITKLACDVAKDTNPNVHRLINNCCPYAEYVHEGRWSGQPATHPQRTPWEFMRDLDEAGVDFTISGVQMYFPGRDLQDIILHIERFEPFGRPVQLTEVGAPSRPGGEQGKVITDEPYEWHRHWDEELQADWLGRLYTLAYSKPWIEAVNWYDFVDPFSYIDNGGLLRSPEGEPKVAYRRLQQVQERWSRLPSPESE